MKTRTRDYREFSETIMPLRLRLGLSQTDFAKLVGVNQATVSKWETGAIAIGRWGRMTLERLDQEITTRRQALKALRRIKALERSKQEAA